MSEFWDRASSVQPDPAPGLVALVAVVALGLVVASPTWPWTRLIVTITHEAGHAVAAVLVGRKLQGIRVHSDTSGLTVSRGKPRGPGMVFVLCAGYLAPALFGLGAALMLTAGRSLGLLWLIVLLLALMLLQIRNFYGFLAVLGSGAVVVAVSWFLEPEQQSLVAYLITWVLLLSSPRPLIELISQRRHGSGTSDPDQLARMTRVPAVVWIVLFLAANLAGLVVGARALLPDVTSI